MCRILNSFFLRSTQGGEITVYGMTETAWQVSSVGLQVEKHRAGMREGGLSVPPWGRQQQQTAGSQP